jgi:Mg2+ and Co2+ transporter CorA
MSDEDRAEAEATLERLDVAVEDDDMYPDIPWAPGEAPLAEDTEEIEAVLDSNEIEVDKEADKAPDSTKEEPLAKGSDADAESQPEAKQTLKEETEELEDDSEEEDIERSETVTVGDFVDLFKDYDKDLKLEFNAIEVNEETINITELIFDDELEDGKVVVSFNYNLETSDNTEESENELEPEESSPEDAEQPETEDASEEAIDDGDDEVIESLKEIVRQKDALEEEVLALKDQKAVSDAEVGRLSEELDKYKTGFMRVSELASKSTKLQKKVAALNEQLAEKNTVIRDLQTQAKTKLNESVDNSKRQLKELQERLITSQNEAEATEQALREQVDTARENARKATTAAKAYQQKYVAVVEHYIASKATMLGVSTHDITSKLNEGYTLEDVDRVCEKLLDAGRPAFNIGMGAQRAPQVKLKESVKKPQYSGGYDIDDDLLELAGLK